jgi:NAD(P)-dependent dehydrogenase (short-subunit alcohol dehydrogenase family)
MKQIVIVGGGGSLGGALIQRLLDQHDNVIAAGRTRPRDERVAAFYRLDAATADWPSLYDTIEKDTARRIDAVIFVSGTAVFGRSAAIPLERARSVFDLNFWACTSAARAAAEYWDRKQLAGKFVAILSIVARRAVPFEGYYAASKAATARFLECLQLEYGHKQIEFVSAFPGMLDTPFRRDAEWYGLEPERTAGGADVAVAAAAIIKLLNGKRKSRVIGWRERTIDLADRLWPGFYDRAVLRARVRKLLLDRS